MGYHCRDWLEAVISPSRPGCERPGDRGGLTLLAPLPSPLHPWGKPLRNRDSPAWLKTGKSWIQGLSPGTAPFVFHAAPNGADPLVRGESSMPRPTLPPNEGAAARTPHLAFLGCESSLPGWTPSGTPAPQAKPGSRAPLRHCALSQASDLNPQGGPAQLQQFPGKPKPSSGACLWWAHFTVWGIFKAPPCGLCAFFLLSGGSVCFHGLYPPHSPTL